MKVNDLIGIVYDQQLCVVVDLLAIRNYYGIPPYTFKEVHERYGNCEVLSLSANNRRLYISIV